MGEAGGRLAERGGEVGAGIGEGGRGAVERVRLSGGRGIHRRVVRKGSGEGTSVRLGEPEGNDSKTCYRVEREVFGDWPRRGGLGSEGIGWRGREGGDVSLGRMKRRGRDRNASVHRLVPPLENQTEGREGHKRIRSSPR